MKNIIAKSIELLLGYIYLIVGRWKRIVSNRVLFMTFQGSYTCNPKYICEKICELYPEIEPIWVRLDNDKVFPSKYKVVKFGSVEYYDALYTSKVLVDNAFNFVKRPYKKKKKQFLIQTMHGSLGIKRIDAKSNINNSRNQRGYRSAKITDYIISNSLFEDDVYKTSFWPDTPILKLGHARNDLLFKDKLELKDITDRVRCFYKVEEDAKLALYAPTFLRPGTNDIEVIDFERLKISLTSRFGGSWYILNRLHPRDSRNKKNTLQQDYILDGNAYEDIQELMVAIDFAITDYSSWIFDYVLMKKPGAIFAPDVDFYSATTGFFYPITSTPFMFAKTNDELMEQIQVFIDGEYIDRVNAFVDQKGCMDDGRASERAAKVIFKLIKNERLDEEE